jgi:hypothetical protein
MLATDWHTFCIDLLGLLELADDLLGLVVWRIMVCIWT